MVEKKTLLVISQVYIPDPAALGQYMADVVEEMVKRDWLVNVITADRGYDDPEVKYPKLEEHSGVHIRRLPFSSFGKRSIFLRMVAGFSFILQCVVLGIFIRPLDCILVSSSPPIAPLAAMAIKKVRRVPIKYWIMDLNPDQMIMLGRISDKSLLSRLFNRLNRSILENADNVITLDKYMARRVNNKINVSKKLSVISPWPLENYLEDIEHLNNPFRKKYKLNDKIVIMYSGNHSLANPFDTLLHAAVKLHDYYEVMFVFIGGGIRKTEIETFINKENPGNIISLPYQPLKEIKYSLSAADVHVVSVGSEMVGVVHPSKAYSAMAIGRPILFLGPAQFYNLISIQGQQIGWQVDHDDIESMVRTIKHISALSPKLLKKIGDCAKMNAATKFNKDSLLAKVCSLIEKENEN